MAKFVLIDHAFTSLGGHHFQYDVPILQAVEESGYEIVYAFDKRFKSEGQLPCQWDAQPTYEIPRTKLYSTLELVERRSRPRQLKRTSSHALWRRGVDWLRELPNERSCRRLERELAASARSFARDTQELFRKIRLEPGDQVFLSDTTPVDLQGLAILCESASLPQGADWHLLFHLPIFPGREPTWDVDSPPVWRLRAMFHQVQRALFHERLHCYATTDVLAEQFNRLGFARFQTLGFPASERLRLSHRRDVKRRPLQVVSMGGLRREKGKHLWTQIVEALGTNRLDRGDLQLVLQAKKKRKLPRPLRRHLTRVPTGQPPLLRLAPYPLDLEGYIQLVLDSDVGLMIYDQENYYYRASGVLVEMLSAGVPVIVMAGTWMSEQITEAISKHHELLLRSTPITESIPASRIAWRRSTKVRKEPLLAPPALSDTQGATREPSDRLTFGGSQGKLVGSLPLIAKASHLLIRFKRPEPTPRGTFVETLIQQQDENGQVLLESREIVNEPPQGRPLSVLIGIAEGARRIELCWKNAFGLGELAVEEVVFHYLAAEKTDAGGVPLGSVGLIAADLTQVPRLLKEMATHHDHYQRTAREFSVDWANSHQHSQVASALLANATANRPSYSFR